MKGSYYYISVGEKSYFYTLNYSYVDTVYIKSGPEQRPFPTPVRRYEYIRNLSHDFDEAIQKAKQWYKEYNIQEPIKLLDSPKAMNEREKGLLEAHLASIKAGFLPYGKHQDKHVTTVDKSYIHWVLVNVYDPDLAEDKQNSMAQICYNYAEEQGWLDEWIKQGQECFNDPNFENEVNELINGDIFLVGRYADQSIKDFGYTKKQKLKVSVQGYLNWFKNEESVVDTIIKKFELNPVLSDDGNEYYILTSHHWADVKGRKPNSSDITSLMVRQFWNRMVNEERGEALYPLYKIKWDNIILPIKTALALSKPN